MQNSKLITIGYGLTKTGTKAILLTQNEEVKKTILITQEGLIISIFTGTYPGVSSFGPFDIADTQVCKYVDIVVSNFAKYGCLWNEHSQFYNNILLASNCQMRDSVYSIHYDYPIHKYVAKFENCIDLYYSEQKNFELISENKGLKMRIEDLKNYRTEDSREIAKIIKNRKIAAEKQAKIDTKTRLALEKETKKMLLKKIKEGYNFVAIRRNWAGSRKHLKFQGESKEFSKTKPLTRYYISLSKENIDHCVKQYL